MDTCNFFILTHPLKKKNKPKSKTKNSPWMNKPMCTWQMIKENPETFLKETNTYNLHNNLNYIRILHE